MRTIEFSVEAAGENFHVSGTIEVEDDATDEQIEEAVSEEVFSIVQWGRSEKMEPSDAGE